MRFAGHIWESVFSGYTFKAISRRGFYSRSAIEKSASLGVAVQALDRLAGALTQPSHDEHSPERREIAPQKHEAPGVALRAIVYEVSVIERFRFPGCIGRNETSSQC